MYAWPSKQTSTVCIELLPAPTTRSTLARFLLCFLPLEEVEVPKFLRRILAYGNLFIVKNDPAPVLLNMADIVATCCVAAHVADEAHQIVFPGPIISTRQIPCKHNMLSQRWIWLL